MGQTPNHEYNVPDQGAKDWHVPLNENFEAFDVDVEIRDQEANRGNYEPVAGAKFLATDTGSVFLGDGENWIRQFVQAIDVDDAAQFETTVDAPTVDAGTVHAETVVATHLQGDLTGGVDLTTLAGNNLAIENGQLNASGGDGSGGGAWEQVDSFLTPTDDAIDGVDLSGTGDRVVVAEPTNAPKRLDLVADGARAVSLGADTDTDSGTDAGNVVHGYAENRTTAGVVGATIGGGGRTTQSGDESNEVYDDYGTVGGGANNRAGSDDDDPVTAQFATIGGGLDNVATEDLTAVAGGKGNAAGGLGAFVGGGTNNTADGGNATIAGGTDNSASANDATVAGGTNNVASGALTFVGGGEENDATAAGATICGGTGSTADLGATVGGGVGHQGTGQYSTIAGGRANTATGDDAAVGGGWKNTASVPAVTVGGGRENEASGEYATVGGGRLNEAKSKYATIAGGGPSDTENVSETNNVVYDDYGTIGGGGNNQAGSNDDDPKNAIYATVAGGKENAATGSFATIGGGDQNSAEDIGTTIAGGIDNGATADSATVAGGIQNVASALDATVGGGFDNEASGQYSTVAGGSSNQVTGKQASIGGGEDNTVSGNHAAVGGGADNTASDQFATVPGGTQNEASGAMSFAAGFKATAQHDGAVVFGDSTLDSISSNGSDEARFQMPVYAPSFNTTSARTAKTGIEPVDPAAVLAGVESLDVPTWEFTDAEDGRHMGPMAGEFHETFGLGDDDGTIAGVDRDGVALAAIQGLSEKLDERDERIDDLEAELEAKDERLETLEAENAQLRERLAAIENHLDVPDTTGDYTEGAADD